MTSEAKWAARVDAWRRSGATAPAFCADKDYAASTLRYWASRLRHDAPQTPSAGDVRIARVVRATSSDPDSPIVVELGRARVGVRRGFDRDALRAVFELLDEREVAR
jgi:hypothetical protein